MIRHLAQQLAGAVAAVCICFGVAILVLEIGAWVK